MSPARRTDPAAVRLPSDLVGPVGLELARAVDTIPGEKALPGGSRYEPKFDGFRAAIVRRGDSARIWSRQRKDLTAQFPDIAAAAAKLPDGVVLDGELIILVDGRLSFDALQRRLVTTPAKARQLVASVPAAYAAFDLLAIGGVDLRTQRWSVRRTRLEQVAVGFGVSPLQLTPVTADLDEAREWFEVLPEAMGVEGLVVKGASSLYAGGHREWLKVKRRDTVDVIARGVLGSLRHPEVVIAGRYTEAGELVMVGRTVPLTAAQSSELGAVLKPARRGHPWPDEISSQRWGGRDSKKPLIKVEPLIVIEVLADAAMQAGQWRHGLRYARYRPDLTPDDVPLFPDSAGS